MNTYIEKIQKILNQKNHMELQRFLRLVYFSIPRRDDLSGQLACKEKAWSRILSGLDFPLRDAIDCAANELHAEVEYAAFTEGFQRGAELILAFLTRS